MPKEKNIFLKVQKVVERSIFISLHRDVLEDSSGLHKLDRNLKKQNFLFHSE